MLVFRYRIGDNTRPRLDDRFWTLHHDRANRDAKIHIPLAAGRREPKVAHRTGIRSSPVPFQFVNDLHRADLGRAGDGARRKGRAQEIKGIQLRLETAVES